MKILLITAALIFSSVAIQAQNYIEWGSSGCGIMAITSKSTLIENGKSLNTLYKLSDRKSLKDSCSTAFILARLSKDSVIKVGDEKAKLTKEIFKQASLLASLPAMSFSYKYCEVSYKISIGKRNQEFTSRSGKSKQQKDTIKKIILLIGQLNQKGT
jgi:hypothetical protein